MGKQLENKNEQASTSNDRHPDSFWVDIDNKLKTDTDAIKDSLENGTISKDDIDLEGWNLLHHATQNGNYEIAKLCINKGYDLQARDKYGQTPLNLANEYGKHDVAQLLMLSEIKGNIGERIKEKAKILNKERGCIENIKNGLTRIGEQTAKIWKDATIEMITNCIQNKQCFDDIFLSLCYEFIQPPNGYEYNSEDGVIEVLISADFEQSELFKAIIATSD